MPTACQEPAGASSDKRPCKRQGTSPIEDAIPDLSAAVGSSALVAVLTKDQVAVLLSAMPDPCSREPGAEIRCGVCSRTYKTASGLVQHLCGIHHVQMDWLAGSKLIRARSLEFSLAKGKWKSRKAEGEQGDEPDL